MLVLLINLHFNLIVDLTLRFPYYFTYPTISSLPIIYKGLFAEGKRRTKLPLLAQINLPLHNYGPDDPSSFPARSQAGHSQHEQSSRRPSQTPYHPSLLKLELTHTLRGPIKRAPQPQLRSRPASLGPAQASLRSPVGMSEAVGSTGPIPPNILHSLYSRMPFCPFYFSCI